MIKFKLCAVVILSMIGAVDSLNAQIDKQRLQELKDFPRQNQLLLKNLQDQKYKDFKELKSLEYSLPDLPAEEIGRVSPSDQLPRDQVDSLVQKFICNYQEGDPVVLGRYQKDSYTENEVTIIRDSHTQKIIDVVVNDCSKDRRLESWWIDASSLQGALKPEPGVDASGVRLFPAVNLASVEIVFNNGSKEVFQYYYHTLVMIPTIEDSMSGTHENHERAWEYVDPCPNVCKGADGEYRLKNCKPCKN